jgi:hypothetical protein
MLGWLTCPAFLNTQGAEWKERKVLSEASMDKVWGTKVKSTWMHLAS